MCNCNEHKQHTPSIHPSHPSRNRTFTIHACGCLSDCALGPEHMSTSLSTTRSKRIYAVCVCDVCALSVHAFNQIIMVARCPITTHACAVHLRTNITRSTPQHRTRALEHLYVHTSTSNTPNAASGASIASRRSRRSQRDAFNGQ